MTLAVYELVKWSFWSHDIWHPLYGLGYQFWSGIAGATAIFTGIYLYIKHQNCHEHGCWRRGKYTIEGGIKCCDPHHPALDKRPVWEKEKGRVHTLHQAHLEHLHLTHLRHVEKHGAA